MNKDSISLASSVLLCIMAGPIPASLSILKKDENTIAIATTPKSDGEISLAKITVTRKLINTLEYLVIAEKNTPLTISLL